MALPMTFPLAGRQIDLKLKPLPGDFEFVLDNYLDQGALGNAKTDPGSARAATAVTSIRNLEVDGVKVRLDSRRRQIPPIRDPETGESLMTAVLKRICEREEWLLEGDYARVFAKYAPEEADEEFDELNGGDGSLAEEGLTNPTQLRVAKETEDSPEQEKSTDGSTSSSGSGQNRAKGTKDKD